MRARGTPPPVLLARAAADRPPVQCSEPPDPRPDGRLDRALLWTATIGQLGSKRHSRTWPAYGTDLDHRDVPTRAPPPPATDPKRRRRSARASHSLTRIKGSHVSAVSRCLPLPLCLVSAGPINTAQDRSAG